MEVSELLNNYEKGHRDFTGADLSGANLSGAILIGVNLSRANLSGAKPQQSVSHQSNTPRRSVTKNKSEFCQNGRNPTFGRRFDKS